MENLLKNATLRRYDFDSYFYYIQLELERSNYLNLIFHQNTIEDYFFDQIAVHGEEKASDKIKDVMLQKPIFGDILRNALNDPNVLDAFKKRQPANYEIKPEHFKSEDFRDKVL